jgi:hypothetical protein
VVGGAVTLPELDGVTEFDAVSVSVSVIDSVAVRVLVAVIEGDAPKESELVSELE